MNDVVAEGGIIAATHRTAKYFFCVPVRWDDRYETWFKTVCILIMSHTKVGFGLSER